MKRLKRFNESKEQDLQILKDYFYNIIDDLESICTVEFQKNTDNYFTFYFRLKNGIRKDITKDNVTEIDNWLKVNDDDETLLKELSASISSLQDEQILANFTLSPVATNRGYVLKIYTKFKNESDVNKWILINGYYEIKIDELRMKSWFKKNFDVEVNYFDEVEDYDRYQQRYLGLDINFATPIDQEKFEKIKSRLLELTCENDEEDIKLKPFDSVAHYSRPTEITSINIYLNSMINDFN